MRVIYDDTMQKSLIEKIGRFFKTLNTKEITKYDHGMDRVQRTLLKEKLQKFLSNYMTIGKTPTVLFGIGNNNAYPVYYSNSADNELQICGYLNLNTNMYSSVFVYVTNYDGEKVSNIYEITPTRVNLKTKI